MRRPTTTATGQGYWKLKAAIALRRVTQRHTAQRAEIPETRLSDFINGRALPSLDEQRRLARTLRLRVDQLFGDEPLGEAGRVA